MFQPNLLLSENEILPRASNFRSYEEYTYFSKPPSLVNLRTQNKEFPNKRSALCLNDHKFIPWAILIFTAFLLLIVNLIYFEHSTSIFHHVMK